jgi:myo-inositol 2-dehydrogenase / D-chiro-inositol 1-dehydrogenase
MSDLKLRVALLGAGRIGQEHSKTLIADQRVQVVAVCDPRLEAARQTAATISGAIATDESGEILSSDQVDAIVICTPTDTHAQLIEEGARAGKAVFCEKPVALDLQRTKEALAVVEEKGVPFQIGFQRRFDSGYAGARKKIARGLLGRIDQFRAVGRDPGPPPKEYLAKSGGLFLDQAIHEFDLARFLVGEVNSVFATGTVRFSEDAAELGDVDTATTILHFENGALGVIENSRRAVYGYDIVTEVFGEAGKLVVQAERKTPLRFFREGGSEQDHHHFFMDRFRDAFRAELEAFFTAVLQRSQPSPGAADAIGALRIGLAATQSRKLGRVVQLDEID